MLNLNSELISRLNSSSPTSTLPLRPTKWDKRKWLFVVRYRSPTFIDLLCTLLTPEKQCFWSMRPVIKQGFNWTLSTLFRVLGALPSPAPLSLVQMMPFANARTWPNNVCSANWTRLKTLKADCCSSNHCVLLVNHPVSHSANHKSSGSKSLSCALAAAPEFN